MKNIKVKTSTIARISALAVALVNQALAVAGQDILPFTENTVYQIASLAVTAITVVINAWYNNDITKAAILSGKVLDALNDGKITEEEIEAMLSSLEATEDVANAEDNFFVKIINRILKAIKKPRSGE